MHMPVANKKKICIYCDTWKQGGIEAFLAETLLHMDIKGLSFRLVCAEKFGSRFDTQLKEKGFLIQALLSRHGTSALGKTLKTAIPLARLCKTEGIDVVHLNIFHGVSLIQAFVLKLYGVRCVVVHCHGAGLRESKYKKLKLLGHGICKRLFLWAADERWAASRQAAKFLFGGKSVRIVPNGINIQRFCFDPKKREELREKLQVGDKLLLGCVGRMDSQKNQQFLLTLLVQAKELGCNVKLLFIGDGIDRIHLEERTKELGLCEDVIFGGNSNCVNEWMCAMDILLIPSTSEGFGITAIEGQASGLRVICSTGVPEEVRLSEVIQFLPLSDMKQWIEAIMTLPANDRVAINKQIQNSSYNIERSSALVRDLYLRI